MKGFWEEKPHHVVHHRGPNGNTVKQMGPAKRLKISSLNSHLICVLCSGYYVEATTIVECLHTFCRSCIVKYLQTNHFCPICDVQLSQAKTWSSLRPDKILQDLVYKLVPGLYQDEMKRRRHFYSRLGEGVDVGEGEEGGFLPYGARFFSQDDSISLSLEYYNGQEEFEDLNLLNKKSKQINEKHKRYLQCPAAVTIRHLKKFLRMKYGIGLDCWVDIIYNDECLPENFTLIDVAYTFAWKRTSPMRFSYRMFRKVGAKAIKPEKNFQISRLDEEDKKSKHQPTLEQQMQSEYLGNFNLNPTNSSFGKSQNCNKSINNCNNNNNATKPKSIFDERKDEHCFINCAFVDEGSREKLFPSSEDSSASGLKIISEKEESLRGNSEDSQESFLLDDKKRKLDTSVPNFGEEAVDSFTAKKLLKNKHKLEERKKKSGENHVEKRRKSASHIEDYEKTKKKSSLIKRRKTVADEFSLQRENEKRNSNDDEEIEVLGNLKNEALRKVFVSKEKPIPESSSKRKEEEIRKKKRKKSRHHEDESKKRKLEVMSTSPSILSFAKDPLKLKVKLTPSKTSHKSSVKRSEHSSSRETEFDSHKSVSKLGASESKRIITDKERLLHLRAVRHKNIVKKHSLKEYINAPPSLTISKVSSSDHKSVKTTYVETKPSLEIVLVSSPNNSKTKTDGSSESRKEAEPKKKEIPVNEVRRGSEKSAVVDNFGVLDLSEKSTRTKESNYKPESSKKKPENVEKTRKTPHQSIMQIAQNLVNRKLSPVLPTNNSKSGFDDRTDPLASAAAMRNLKTLSDTAVNILMASQNKNYPPEPRKRLFPSLSVPPPKVVTPPNSTKSSKDCENGTGLKIPVFPISRDRMHPIPPVPNLHEIYPRGRGKPVPASRPSTPIIKPGQNQTVRQIPNPFNVLNRQGNQNQNLVKPPSPSSPPPSPQLRPENNEEVNSKPALDSIPPLQSIKTKTPVPKSDDLAELSSDKNSNDIKSMLMPKIVNNINNITNNNNNNNNNNSNSNNNNTKTVQNGSECNLFGLKNGEERKSVIKLNGSSNPVRKAENMAKNIESVAAGLTARAVSNAMIDAK